MPPVITNTRLSVRNCCASRDRAAPIARRTAISRWRATERATSKLETLRQAMSSTMQTAPSRTSSGWRTDPVMASRKGCTPPTTVAVPAL
jgi:hypothetical protein